MNSLNPSKLMVTNDISTSQPVGKTRKSQSAVETRNLEIKPLQD
jgi:hypothetical protein